MITRREPLLWLQLMALAVIPLELELLRLLLAGSSFGPSPALERLLVWSLSVVAPGYWLVQRPVDWGSLLLVRQPLSTRQIDQRRISALQQSPVLRIATVFGMVLLLMVFWWIDRSALLVIDLSPLREGSRLTGLLLSGLLLSLLLWQWQQLCSSLWLLTRSDTNVLAVEPLSDEQMRNDRTSFGFGLLTLPTLTWSSPSKSSGLSSGPIEPEQASEQNDRSDLDQEVTGNDGVPSTEAKSHHEETQTTGTEQSDPEETPESPPGSA